MKFGFVAKHRGIWPAEWLCGALGVSRGGFYAWLTRPRSQRSRSDEDVGARVRASFLASDRTYGSRRVWHDLLAEGVRCGRHRIERLMRQQALKARPRRRRLPPGSGERQVAAVAPTARPQLRSPRSQPQMGRRLLHVCMDSGGLAHVAAVVDLFSRRVVGWSMSAEMTAQLVTDALVMAIWRRGKPDALLHHSDRGSRRTAGRPPRRGDEDEGTSELGGSSSSGGICVGEVSADGGGEEGWGLRMCGEGGGEADGRKEGIPPAILDRRSALRDGIFRLPNGRRSPCCAPRASQCRRLLVGLEGQRRRSHGNCGAMLRLEVAV